MESHPKDLRYFLQILEEGWPGEVLRIDTEGKEFNLAECDAAAFLAKLKASGKRPASLFRGFKTLSGKYWQGELLFSEVATHRKQAAAMDLSGDVAFHDLNRQGPSTERYMRVGGLIIDSTKPVGKPFPEIGRPPDGAMSRIRLEDFVSAAELGKVAG